MPVAVTSAKRLEIIGLFGCEGSMISFLKGLLIKSQTLDALLGEPTFVTAEERGASKHSLFEWRVKEALSQREMLVAARLVPDGYVGAEGKPVCHIAFDIETAVRLRDHLDACIEIAKAQRRRRTLEARSASEQLPEDA